MNARPVLQRIADALEKCGLEAILIGNAAAALQGAQVTTVGFDFMFRETPTNLRKLKAVARELRGVIYRPYYPVSGLYRLVNDDAGLHVDFMPVIHGVRSFERLRSRAAGLVLGKATVQVADLADVVRSKRAAGRGIRPCCQCRRPHLKNADAKSGSPPGRRARLQALRLESDRDLIEQIRRLLAVPMFRRMNFLRRRLPRGRLSALIRSPGSRQLGRTPFASRVPERFPR